MEKEKKQPINPEELSKEELDREVRRLAFLPKELTPNLDLMNLLSVNRIAVGDIEIVSNEATLFDVFLILEKVIKLREKKRINYAG